MKFLVIITLFFLINCTTATKEINSKDLVGSWEGDNQIWVFNDNGVAYVNAHGFGKPTRADWFIKKNELNLITKNGIKLLFNVKINKDTLFYKSPIQDSNWFKLYKSK